MLIKISPTKDPKTYDLEIFKDDKRLLKRTIGLSISFQEVGQIQNMVIRSMRQMNDRTLDFLTESGHMTYNVQINVSTQTMTVEGNSTFYDVFSLHFQKAQRLERIYSPAHLDETITDLLQQADEEVTRAADNSKEPFRPRDMPGDPEVPQAKAPVLMGAQALASVKKMREIRGKSNH